MPTKRCTDCGLENDPDALSCSRCGASLPRAVEPPPPGAEPEARTVVLRTFTSQMKAQVVADHLQSAGISVVVGTDDCGGLLPFLSQVHGFHLLVKSTDLARAEEALRDIEAEFGMKSGGAAGDTGVPTDAPRPPMKLSPAAMMLGLFFLGGGFGWLGHYATTTQSADYTGTDDRDFNGDGRPDAWWTYRKGQLAESSLDRNFDGNPDSKTFFSPNGWSRSGERDDNFDGRPDIWFF